MIKNTIPNSIVKFVPEGVLTSKSIITVSCSCGSESQLQVASVIRTIKRVGSYRCLSCGMMEKHKDPDFRKKHSDGIKSSWSSEKKIKQSEISKKLWSDPEFKENQRDASNKAWSDPLKKQEASERAILSWDDEKRDHYQKIWTNEKRSESSSFVSDLWKHPEYINKQIVTKNSPEHIELQRRLAVERWQDPNYRNMVTETLREMWVDDPSLRQQMSDRMTALWNDESYKSKQRVIAIDPALCKLKSDNAKKQWQDPIFRQTIIDKLVVIWNSPEYQKIASDNSKKQWQNSDFRKKQAIARSNILLNGKDSILERTTQTLLGSLGIEYIRHHVLGYFEFDLFIPSHKLLVECNGEYWHSLRKAADASKFTYVNEYFPDHKVLYLWERDFLNPGLIHQKIVKALDLDDEELLEQNDFSFSSVDIKTLSIKDVLPGSYYSEPEEFLQSFHYAGFGRSAKTIYGAFLNGVLVGICKFASPMRAESATSMGFSQSQVLELDRFCIHPRFHKKNFASWFMSRCMKNVLDDHLKIQVLISFADLTYDHVGTIYKASNWEFLHEVKPSYHYISQDGFVIHKKTLYDHASRHSQKESDYADLHGYVMAFGRTKNKFCYRRK